MTVWVADTNLLLPSSSRRLLLGLAASRGERLGVTRTVAEEMRAKLPRYMQNARERSTAKPLSYAESEHLANACHRWLDRNVSDRDDAPIRLLTGTHSVALIDDMPSRAFAPVVDRHEHNDAYIIAEAIAGGASLLLTNNIRSIRHTVINEWWRERFEKPASDSLLANSDEGIERLLRGNAEIGEALCDIALAMCVSDIPRDADEDALSLERMIRSLKEHYPFSAQIAWRAFATTKDRSAKIAFARDLAGVPAWRAAGAPRSRCIGQPSGDDDRSRQNAVGTRWSKSPNGSPSCRRQNGSRRIAGMETE